MPRLRRLLRWALFAVAGISLLGVLALGTLYMVVSSKLPDVQALRHVELQEPMYVYARDGRLMALDSATGAQLWEFQTGAGMHAPVSTFEHKGKQYLLAFSAGSALIGSARGDSLWLFGLDGTLGPVQSGTPVSRNAAATAATGSPTWRTGLLNA